MGSALGIGRSRLRRETGTATAGLREDAEIAAPPHFRGVLGRLCDRFGSRHGGGASARGFRAEALLMFTLLKTDERWQKLGKRIAKRRKLGLGRSVRETDADGRIGIAIAKAKGGKGGG